MPVAGQFLLYIENQLSFLDRLETKFLDSVSIRLDSSNESRGWDIPKALDVAGYSKYVDRSNERIPSLLSRSRLCICTHNATVFLECLEMNFPTIIFWEPSHHEIRDDAVPFFDLLLEAGVLFYTPEAAAKKVNTVAHNVRPADLSRQLIHSPTQLPGDHRACARDRYQLSSKSVFIIRFTPHFNN